MLQLYLFIYIFLVLFCCFFTSNTENCIPHITICSWYCIPCPSNNWIRKIGKILVFLVITRMSSKKRVLIIYIYYCKIKINKCFLNRRRIKTAQSAVFSSRFVTDNNLIRHANRAVLNVHRFNSINQIWICHYQVGLFYFEYHLLLLRIWHILICIFQIFLLKYYWIFLYHWTQYQTLLYHLRLK